METANIDFWRQLDLFNPESFGEKEIHVIGVGATGSWSAFILAKMGCKNIHVWDFDKVESHNLPNQVYRVKDAGKLKVAALQEIILESAGTSIVVHNEEVTGKTPLQGIVFLMVDKMSIRKEIWQAIRFNAKVDLMVETRMAIDNGRVYAISPFSLSDIKFWENTLYSDEEAEPSACSNRSVAPTAANIATLAIWKMIKWFKGENYNKELIISLRSAMMLTGGQ